VDYIYFVGGVLLFISSAVCSLLAREGDGLADWRLIGGSALLLGARRALGFAAYTQGLVIGWPEAELLCLAGALFLLAEAGRRAWKFNPLYFYSPLAVLFAAGLNYGVAGGDLGARLAFGLTGGLLVSYRFFGSRGAHRSACARRAVLLMTAGMALYSLFSAVTPPASAFLYAASLNIVSVSRSLGFGAEYLSMMLLGLMGAGVWVYFFTSRDGCSLWATRAGRTGLAAAAVFLSIFAAGWALTEKTSASAEREFSRHLSLQARILAGRFAGLTLRADAAAEALSGSPLLLEYLGKGGPVSRAGAESALDRYCGSHRLSVCYLMDMNGRTLLASNRGEPDSFVGKNYSFRPYFAAAAAGGRGVGLAVGLTSGERGYYAAAPVRLRSGVMAGVAAVKINVSDIAPEMAAADKAFLVSPEGVIFMSADRADLFRTLWPVPAERRAELASSRQYLSVRFDPVLPAEIAEGGRVAIDGKEFVARRVLVGPEGWSLVVMQSGTPVHMARLAAISAAAVAALLSIIFFVFYSLSESARDKAEEALRLKEQVGSLEGIISICASCKKIRDDKGYWNQVEAYIARHPESSFSHALCPACARKLYPEYCDDKAGGGEGGK